ncbi:MAG: hypothetical protein ABIQ31_00025 [Ferruginibacter sp.]
MKQMKFSTAIVVILVALFLPGCKKSVVATPEIIAPKNNIAYIYKTDNSDGLAFKALLEENDCHVMLIDKFKVPSIDYSDYNLIVIDHNTDEISIGSSWTREDTAAIQASGKPMLLIGIGGLQYANKIKNTANFLNTSQWNDKAFWVKDKTGMLYNKPYKISIPTSTPQVTLYPGAVQAAGQLTFAGTLDKVTLFGDFVVAKNYCPVTFEKNRYLTFGFYKGVESMTSNGRNFMVNLVYYVGNLAM